jgi:hypothetical protein
MRPKEFQSIGRAETPEGPVELKKNMKLCACQSAQCAAMLRCCRNSRTAVVRMNIQTPTAKQPCTPHTHKYQAPAKYAQATKPQRNLSHFIIAGRRRRNPALSRRTAAQGMQFENARLVGIQLDLVCWRLHHPQVSALCLS